MRYYKVVKNGELQLIGTGSGGEEISKGEYQSILEDLKQINVESFENTITNEE